MELPAGLGAHEQAAAPPDSKVQKQEVASDLLVGESVVAGKRGEMRLHFRNETGSVISVAYKAISDEKTHSFVEKIVHKLFYTKLEVTISGKKTAVLVNLGSLSKHLGITRSNVRQTDQKSLSVFVKHQAFISSLVKQGLSGIQAQYLAQTINTNFPKWTRAKQDVYQRKEGKQARTIEYVKEHGEVYVHLKSKGKGLLGSGGMGKVTKTVIFSTGEVIAQKTVKKAGLGHEEIKKEKVTLRSEGEKYEMFKGCSNIIQVKHVGTHGLLLEFMNGGDLSKLPRDVSLATKRSIIVQMLNGLSQLHEKQMVHCDLKLENFLMKKNDDGTLTVKVADLGLAEKTGKVESGSGSSWIHSPSRLEGILKLTPGRMDPKDDMFALGIALYEMEYGHTPSFCETIVHIRTTALNLDKMRGEMYSELRAPIREATTDFSDDEKKALAQKLATARDLETLDLSSLGDKITPAIKELAKEYVANKERLQKFFGDPDTTRSSLDQNLSPDFQQLANDYMEVVKITRAELADLKQEINDFFREVPPEKTIQHLIWSLLQVDGAKRPSAQELLQIVEQLTIQDPASDIHRRLAVIQQAF